MKEIKKLGFGAMRLPKLDDGTIDLPQVCDMVDLFVSRGFTYFDTAYVYGMGDSERALRECLVKRYPRESFTLATKLPSFLLKEDNDKDRIFKESLDNLGTDFVDFYLLHNVNSGSIKTGHGWNNFEKPVKRNMSDFRSMILLNCLIRCSQNIHLWTSYNFRSTI